MDERDTAPLLQKPVAQSTHLKSVSTQYDRVLEGDLDLDNDGNAFELQPVEPSSSFQRQPSTSLPSPAHSDIANISAMERSMMDASSLPGPFLESDARMAVPYSPRLEDSRYVQRISKRLSFRRSTLGRPQVKNDRSARRSAASFLAPDVPGLPPASWSHSWSYHHRQLWSNHHPTAHQKLDSPSEDDFGTVDISFLEGPDSKFVSHQAASISAKGIESPAPRFTLQPPQEDTNEVIVHNTAREYGQQLANENNMIVSVKEAIPENTAPAVDLSSLEGADRHSVRRGGSSSAAADNEASFFYPTDPEKPDWKPYSMTVPYLLMLAGVSLTLAAVQEYLYQRSQALEAKGQGLIQYNDVAEIPTPQFFAWKYLPTMVMVSYGVLWQIMEYNVKRLEPYYQLSQPTGNVASKSLNLDYTTLFSYFVPYKAFRNRHWTVLVASIGAVLATTAAPSLQNASLMPIQNPFCSTKQVCRAQDKPENVVHISAVWSRLVTICLAMVAILAVVLLLQLRRKSGLLSDPKGIAGIASMATKSHILNDFQGMDIATDHDIHKRLRHRRYVLYKSSIWQGEYIRYNSSVLNGAGLDAGLSRSTTSPQPIALRKGPGIAFLVYLALLVAATPIVTYTSAKVVAIKLPWLPVLLAVIAKQIWTALEFAIKMLEPFYALSQGNARPDNTLTLDYQGVPYGLLPFQAILNHHYLVSLIGFGSILSDVLTVTSASLSIKDETEKSYMTSSALSTIILFFLLCSATLALVCRRHYFVPRPPSTIASILAFVHQSHMLDDFVNTERFSNDQMRAMLVSKNKRYGLGWFRGRDGEIHCGVDEEPLLTRYVHGQNYKDTQAGSWEFF